MYSDTNKAAINGGIFDRASEVQARLQYAPGEAARQELGLPSDVLPGRWNLRTIRATFDWLADYSLSGVWRILERYDCKLRSSRVRQYSPDPDYAEKVLYLEACLRQVADTPETHVLLFMDEMGYYRWAAAAPDWMPVAPYPSRATSAAENNRQWRIVGVLNAWTGQVNYLDHYIVGRQKIIDMYQAVDQLYPYGEHIYVVQDNWSIHKHPDVTNALEDVPRIEPVWLPTYSPWLNPIEKLWRWLRQDVLKMHRLALDWDALRLAVNTFLDQFANGSQDLLHYVGLLGEGRLSQARRGL